VPEGGQSSARVVSEQCPEEVAPPLEFEFQGGAPRRSAPASPCALLLCSGADTPTVPCSRFRFPGLNVQCALLCSFVLPNPSMLCCCLLYPSFPFPLQLYMWFNPTPVASASLAQVHQARLKDGTLVAVKVTTTQAMALNHSS